MIFLRYFESILKAIDSSITEVELFRDGSWQAITGESENNSDQEIRCKKRKYMHTYPASTKPSCSVPSLSTNGNDDDDVIVLSDSDDDNEVHLIQHFI